MTVPHKQHPAMFRNHPVLFCICCLLIVAHGLGLVLLLLWWLKCLGTTLTIEEDRTILRRGLLSKHTSDVRHVDVRNVQIDQGILQRMFGVGTVGVSSSDNQM